MRKAIRTTESIESLASFTPTSGETSAARYMVEAKRHRSELADALAECTDMELSKSLFTRFKMAYSAVEDNYELWCIRVGDDRMAKEVARMVDMDTRAELLI